MNGHNQRNQKVKKDKAAIPEKTEKSQGFDMERALRQIEKEIIENTKESGVDGD